MNVCIRGREGVREMAIPGHRVGERVCACVNEKEKERLHNTVAQAGSH